MLCAGGVCVKEGCLLLICLDAKERRRWCRNAGKLSRVSAVELDATEKGYSVPLKESSAEMEFAVRKLYYYEQPPYK